MLTDEMVVFYKWTICAYLAFSLTAWVLLEAIKRVVRR